MRLSRLLQPLIVFCAALALLLLLWTAAQPDQPAAAPVTPPPEQTATAGPPAPAETPVGRWPQLEGTAIPALSNSGRLVFVCEGAALCLMNADGSQRAVIYADSNGGTFTAPRWAPDGAVFVALYEYDPARSTSPDRQLFVDIVLFSAAGQELARFSGDQSMTLINLRRISMEWSNGGARLAVAAARDLNHNGVLDEPGMVWLLERPTLAAIRSFNLPAAVAGPLWSPDDRWLAFETAAEATAQGNHELRLYNIGSGELRLVAVGSDPAWGPGSHRLTYVDPPRTSVRQLELSSELGRTLLDSQILAAQSNQRLAELGARNLTFVRPQWSPDGTYLAVGLELSGDSQTAGVGLLLTLEPNGAIRRWPDTGSTAFPRQRWSPNSRYLIYSYRVEADRDSLARSTHRCSTGLMLVDVRDATYQEVACDMNISRDSPAVWSPEGNRFAVNQGTALLVFSVSPADSWSFLASPAGDLDWGGGLR